LYIVLPNQMLCNHANLISTPVESAWWGWQIDELLLYFMALHFVSTKFSMTALHLLSSS
jgi:hypothetical protein